MPTAFHSTRTFLGLHFSAERSPVDSESLLLGRRHLSSRLYPCRTLCSPITALQCLVKLFLRICSLISVVSDGIRWAELNINIASALSCTSVRCLLVQAGGQLHVKQTTL